MVLYLPVSHILVVGPIQAGGFLCSSKYHPAPEERELQENVFQNDHYAEDTSLLDQVLVY